MSSRTAEKNDLGTMPATEPIVTPKRRGRPAQATQPEPQPVARRRSRTATPNRAYWIVQVDAAGDIVGMILKLPTIGQARKARENASKAAKVPLALTRIVRTVIID